MRPDKKSTEMKTPLLHGTCFYVQSLNTQVRFYREMAEALDYVGRDWVWVLINEKWKEERIPEEWRKKYKCIYI